MRLCRMRSAGLFKQFSSGPHLHGNLPRKRLTWLRSQVPFVVKAAHAEPHHAARTVRPEIYNECVEGVSSNLPPWAHAERARVIRLAKHSDHLGWRHTLAQALQSGQQGSLNVAHLRDRNQTGHGGEHRHGLAKQGFQERLMTPCLRLATDAPKPGAGAGATQRQQPASAPCVSTTLRPCPRVRQASVSDSPLARDSHLSTRPFGRREPARGAARGSPLL